MKEKENKSSNEVQRKLKKNEKVKPQIRREAQSSNSKQNSLKSSSHKQVSKNPKSAKVSNEQKEDKIIQTPLKYGDVISLYSISHNFYLFRSMSDSPLEC